MRDPPAPTDEMTDKRSLRRRLRAARAVATPCTLTVPAAFGERLAPGIVVAAYVPIGGEVDPAPLVAAARAAGGVIALPHVVDHATPIRFLAADGTLRDGPFGLRQPGTDAVVLTPDIILTPLVGFDRHGNRLGQGAGHYDRAFAEYPAAWRIGLALALQEVPVLPADPWDVPLHAILTEREWIVPIPSSRMALQ
jgi:5-formyltetrahydrofolate cyclo-ligase